MVIQSDRRRFGIVHIFFVVIFAKLYEETPIRWVMIFLHFSTLLQYRLLYIKFLTKCVKETMLMLDKKSFKKWFLENNPKWIVTVWIFITACETITLGVDLMISNYYEIMKHKLILQNHYFNITTQSCSPCNLWYVHCRNQRSTHESDCEIWNSTQNKCYGIQLKK